MQLFRGSLARRALVATVASFALVASLTVSGQIANAQEAGDESGGSETLQSTAQPAAPTLLQVTGADSSIIVTYRPSQAATTTGYQVSPDGYSWFDCPDLSGTCGLSALTNGRQYRPGLRAVGPAGVSDPVAAPPTTPELAPGADPDKPTPLPRPRTRVTAKFNAASNSLGVNGARTKLGVGTLPRITFNRSITDKAAVERHLVVAATSDEGRSTEVQGAWGWINDRTTIFRPKNFWPGNSTIEITSTLDDVVLGKSKGRYLLGSSKLERVFTFRTDRSLIAEVDGASKRMKVFIDGKRVQNFPVSLGKAGWETRNGAKVISTDKEDFKVYRSASLGLTDPDDFYELDAPWNTRLTPTGEFLHAAPWAYGRLGRYNGSHGCTNMFANDAKWVFDNTIPGDVVTFRNTGGDMMEPWNGPGGLWNISWDKWLKKSALGSGNRNVDSSAVQGDVDQARPASA